MKATEQEILDFFKLNPDTVSYTCALALGYYCWQSSIEKRIRKLAQKGILTRRKDGKQYRYSLASSVPEEKVQKK